METQSQQGQPASVGTPSMPGDGSMMDEADTGYTIEIEVAGDGSITVSAETSAQEESEGSGESAEGADGSSGDNEGTPVDSIEEALDLAKQIFKNNGQMPKSNGMSVEQAFKGGFDGGSAQ